MKPVHWFLACTVFNIKKVSQLILFRNIESQSHADIFLLQKLPLKLSLC